MAREAVNDSTSATWCQIADDLHGKTTHFKETDLRILLNNPKEVWKPKDQAPLCLEDQKHV